MTKTGDQLEGTQFLRHFGPLLDALRALGGSGTPSEVVERIAWTLRDPSRFTSSRQVGAYVGLAPASRASGQRNPQLRISKQGNSLLRRLLVQGAHHLLARPTCDGSLRRFGLRLAAQGGKRGKKRAVAAVARKLAVLLHHLWRSGEAYEPMRGTAQAPDLAA